MKFVSIKPCVSQSHHSHRRLCIHTHTHTPLCRSSSYCSTKNLQLSSSTSAHKFTGFHCTSIYKWNRKCSDLPVYFCVPACWMSRLLCMWVSLEPVHCNWNCPHKKNDNMNIQKLKTNSDVSNKSDLHCERVSGLIEGDVVRHWRQTQCWYLTSKKPPRTWCNQLMLQLVDATVPSDVQPNRSYESLEWAQEQHTAKWNFTLLYSCTLVITLISGRQKSCRKWLASSFYGAFDNVFWIMNINHWLWIRCRCRTCTLMFSC